MKDMNMVQDKVISMLKSVSYFESSHNKVLRVQTGNLLKALDYCKAVFEVEKNKLRK